VSAPVIVRYEITPRLLQVRAVRRLTPNMTRVTLGGAELDGFREAGPADHVKVFFPAEGADAPVLPTFGPNGPELPPGAPRPTFRDYTVRSYRPDRQELDIDFVIHGDGPASSWAALAAAGQQVGVVGPRGSKLVPDRDWYLVAGDETALPAVARWLERIPAGRTVLAFAEVADAAEEQELSSAADVTMTWLHRDGAEPGTTTLLADTIRAAALPPGDGYVFVAGEATSLRAVRRYLRDELALPRESWVVDGYWKRGVHNHDHHAVEED
jgi:NADPH-dependent ferric siderophore reductase